MTSPALGAEEAPTPPRSSPGRLGGCLRRAGLAALLLVLLLGAFLLSLDQRPFEGWWLARLSDRIEVAAGLRIRAEDVDVRWWRGELEVRGLVLSAKEESPFLEVERTVARWRWKDLYGAGGWTFEEILVETPRLDLEAPLPGKEGDEEAPEPGPIPLNVAQFAATDGRVEAETLVSRGWLAGFAAESLRLSGRLAAGELVEGSFEGDLLLHRADLPASDPVPLEVAGSVLGPLGGPWRVERLEAAGEGLDLEVVGEVERGARRLPARLDLHFEPARLLPDLAAGAGVVEAEGELELRGGVGQLELVADRFPAEILEPFLDPQLFERLAADGTTLGGRAMVETSSWSIEGLRAEGDARWRRGEETLVATEFRLPGEEETLRLDLDARLLPGRAGLRTARGALVWPDAEDLATVELEAVRLHVEEGDTRDLVTELHARWPGFVPELPEGLLDGPEGRRGVNLDARLDGPPDDFRMKLEGELGEDLRITADGRPLEPSGKALVRLKSFDLAALGTEGIAGALDGEVSLEGRPGAWRGAGDLEGRDLTLGEGAPRWRQLEITATLEKKTLRIAELRGVAEPEGEDGGLELAGTGELRVEQPFRHGWLELEGRWPEQAVENARARLEIEEGVLYIDAPSFSVAGGTGEGELVLPLASLGRIAGLRELLANQPVVTAGGPLTLRFVARGLDSEVMARSLGEEAPPWGLSGDLRAELEVEPALPLAATGHLELPGGRLRVPMGWVEAEGEPEDLIFDLGPEGLRADFGDGLLNLQMPAVSSGLGDMSLTAAVPLTLLARLAELEGESFTRGPVVDPLHLDLEGFWRGFDSSALLARFGREDLPARWSGDLRWTFHLDPEEVSGLEGRLEMSPLAVEVAGEQTLEAESGAVVQLEAGRIELLPVRFRSSRRDLVARGSALLEGLPRTLEQLAAGPGKKASPIALRDLSLDVRGPVPARLLEPFLAGGLASGVAEVDLKVEGDPGPVDALDLETLETRLEVSGSGLRILYVDPYLTEIRDPTFRMISTPEGWRIEEGRAELNDGTLDFNGLFRPASGVELEGFFDRVAYRLDYGLNTLTSGNFNLRWPFEGTPHLEANLLLERGVLRRDLDLDRELLETLFGPPQITGISPATGPELELDISLATVDGVRVRNNLADLRATWSPISITGPVSQPVIEGGIDLEPGGRLSAYGQIVQIDSGSMTWSGIPGTAPEVEIETTNSLEDHTLGGRRGDLFATGDEDTRTMEEALASGLESYYGTRLASSLLGDSLGRTRISYRPLLIFGETNPEAQLTLSRDLSPIFAFAVAENLRGSQERTYLLELHNLAALPGFTAQAFTQEIEESDDVYGGAVLKTFEFGGNGEDDLRLRLVDVVVNTNDAVPEKAIRRAMQLEEGDRVPEDVEFEVELDVRDALERRGFLDPEVLVQTESVGGSGRDRRLLVEVQAGPKVEFEFTGDEPPRALRESITTLYRPGFGQEGAVLEMKERAVDVYRALGYPYPVIEARVTPEDPPPMAPRTLTLHIVPGERWKLGEPVFTGVEPEVAERLAESFVPTRSRIELALGTEAADARLLAALEREGFTGPRILGRTVEPKARRLEVELDPGSLRTLESIAIEGLPEEDSQRLRPTLPLALGDPARAGRIAEAAVRVESDLRRRGFTRARVRASLEGLSEDPLRQNLVLRAEPGRQRRVAEVRSQGQHYTRESWVLRVADLDPDDLLRSREVAAARRRLLSTGVFSRVQVETVPRPAEEGAVPTDVIFDLEEHPRYSIAAGLRWVSDEKLGVVLDLVDRNALGRGATVGLRTRYAANDQSLRLYSVVHHLLATPNNLELFAQRRERRFEKEAIDTVDFSVQLTRRLNERWRRSFYGRFREETTRPVEEGTETREESPLLGMQLIYGEQQIAELEPEGLFGSVDLSGALADWGGGQDVLRLFTQVNTYRGFEVLGQRFTWGQSVRLGWAETFGEGPLRKDLRFRAGGELSVRGYRTDTLGPLPEEEGTEAPGGAGLLVINQELRFPLRTDLQGLVFLDLGNVWENPEDLGRDLRHSLGLGVRAATPIGLLRFDLAWPIDRREQDEALKIYIGFGNIF